MTEEEIELEFLKHSTIEVGKFLYKEYCDHLHIVNFFNDEALHVVVYTGKSSNKTKISKIVSDKLEKYYRTFDDDYMYVKYTTPKFYQDFFKLNQL